MMTKTKRFLLQVLVFAFCLFSVIAVSGAAATRELSSKKRARLRGQRDSQTQDGEPPARNLLHGDILLEAASNERELLGMIGNTETRNHIVRKPSGKGEKTRPVVHPLDIQERQGDEEDLEATPIDASVPEATSSDQEEEVEFEEEDARKEKSNKKEKGKDKGKDDNEEEEEEEKEAEDVVKDEVGDNEEEEEYERETEGAVRDEVDGNEEQEQQPEQKGKGKKDESATAEPEEEAELPEDDQGENYTVEDVPLSGNTGRYSGAGAQMTEFHVAFQYKLSSKENPSKEDYSELAWITADLFDYIFRSYFLDIEEVTFEEVDRLPIYSVKGPTYVDFTLAAYFGPDSSLPTESQLTDISLISLHEGSAYYQYYLQLLQSLESDSPFRTVERVQLYKYSALTGPGEMSEPATPRNTTRVFMVVIPIVILVVAIVVATLIYISWMESQDASSNEDATVNKRKLGEQSDGEQTIPSEGGISFSNQYRSDFDDDVLRQLSTSKKAKKVRHSPRVIRRTFNDDEFSAKIGFEEVSLGDDHDHDEAYYDQKDDDTDDSTAEAEQTQVATNGDSRGVTISALMNEFSQVLDRAPTTVRRFPAPEKKSLLKNDGTSESRIEIEPKKDVSFTSLGSTVDLNGDKYATIEDDVTDDSVVDEMEDNHCSTDDAIETSEPYLEEEVLEDGDFEYEEETVESISTEIKECPHDDGKATTKVEENKSIPTSIQTESTEKASDEIEESGTSSPKEEEEKCTESTGEDKPEVPDVPSGSGLRNFWEQKTAKKGSLHDFWEQKAKGKST